MTFSGLSFPRELSFEAKLAILFLSLVKKVSGQTRFSFQEVIEIFRRILPESDWDNPCSPELALGELVLMGCIREDEEGDAKFYCLGVDLLEDSRIGPHPEEILAFFESSKGAGLCLEARLMWLAWAIGFRERGCLEELKSFWQQIFDRDGEDHWEEGLGELILLGNVLVEEKNGKEEYRLVRPFQASGPSNAGSGNRAGKGRVTGGVSRF